MTNYDCYEMYMKCKINKSDDD